MGPEASDGSALDKDEIIGTPTGSSMVVVERGPVSQFAASLTETNPVYRDADAARAAGLAGIPAPPTYFFSAADFWGAFKEEQPPNARPDRNPVMEVIGKLRSKGGMILHGEQEFEYHKPVVVGDRITSEGKIVDLYEKQAGEHTMTFLVTENQYRNQHGELVLTSRTNLIHRS